MTGALVNIGELSKPATVLINRISEAVGGVFKPYQIVRVAKAEADAEMIRAAACIEIQDLQRRALHRFLLEEGAKQENMESITSQALPQLTEDSTPENLEKDWITNFFDKCRLISDKEMQNLWSRVLAGEATSPGTFSKRTVNFLASLDRSDAATFRSLCSFIWMIGAPTALVFETQGQIYNERGINFGSLTQLDAIGLVRLDCLSGFCRQGLPKSFTVGYFGTLLQLEMPLDADNQLAIGQVLLTKLGRELATICGTDPHPEFYDYVAKKWEWHLPKPSPSPEPRDEARSEHADAVLPSNEAR